MASVWLDLRYALRFFAKQPGLAVVTMLMLALGIGGAATMYSFFLPIAFDFPNVPHPRRLTRLWATNLSAGLERNTVSVADLLDWREQSEAFEEIAAYESVSHNLTAADEPARVFGRQVTAGYFRALGAQPVLGRTFRPEDNAPGAHPVVVVSRALWQRNFGGDPEILGRTVALDRTQHTVVGVMPDGLAFLGSRVEFWVPLQLGPERLKRQRRTVMALARLAPRATWKQARAEMDTIAGRLAAAYPDTNSGWGVRSIPLSEEVSKRFGQGLVFLLGPAIFLLLIGCVNVANLLLARAAVREREVAVRAALGASRWRLVRQLLTESMLLALAGGVMGLLLGFWGVGFFRTVLARAQPYAAQRIEMNFEVLGFAVLLSALTPLLFGLAPALHATKVNLTEALKEGRKRPAMTVGRYSFPDLLVVLELVLAVPFVILVVMWLGIFRAMEDVEPGFDPKNLLAVYLPRAESRAADDLENVEFYRRIMEHVAAVPGVEATAAVSRLPSLSSGRSTGEPITLEGASAGGQANRFAPPRTIVTPGYRRAMGIPLLHGRDFSLRDAAGTAPVALVSESMARRYWPGEVPLGKRFKLGTPQSDSPWFSVVGVVGDVMTNRRLENVPALIYLSHRQQSAHNLYVVVRTVADPLEAVGSVKGAVWSVEPDQPLEQVRTMQQHLTGGFAGSYTMVGLTGIFAGLGLLLGGVGLYAVLSYSVAQRTREFGIRVALGARRGDILRLVLRRGMALAASGLGMGAVATLALARVIEHEMVALSFTAPAPYVGVLLLLFGVAFLACYLPARRATAVNPMEALRYE